MFKILIILILIGYAFYKVTSFLFSGLFRGFVKDQEHSGRNNQCRTSKRRTSGNVDIDSMPKNKSRKSSDSYGGEYVDYEEVK
ncbi:MAG: DUF4834 domain-containing protein [Bacteroidota bacterium]